MTMAEPASATLPSATLLQLMWLASPALPVGGFSYSEGLESAVDTGRASGESGVADWLCAQLQLVQARSEWPLAAAAFQAWQAQDVERVQALNTWLLSTRDSSESRQQTEQMGRSLAEWLRQRAAADESPDPRVAQLLALSPAPSWPVAFALAAQRTGASVHDALLALGFGWAENMVQAAVKTVPLGQNAGQRLLSALTDALPAAVDTASRHTDDSRQAYAPMLAIVAGQHEAQYSRLFRS
jgi:urease accessory protein